MALVLYAQEAFEALLGFHGLEPERTRVGLVRHASPDGDHVDSLRPAGEGLVGGVVDWIDGEGNPVLQTLREDPGQLAPLLERARLP